jgi:hypothetical protein
MDECGSAAGAGRLKAGAVEEAHLRCWLAGRSGVVGEWKRTGEQRGWWPGARPAAATGRFLGGWRASVCPISYFVYCIPSREGLPSCPRSAHLQLVVQHARRVLHVVVTSGQAPGSHGAYKTDTLLRVPLRCPSLCLCRTNDILLSAKSKLSPST